MFYRMTRANETMEDARILANTGQWNACVNRFYYACSYAVSALLVRHSLSSSKHTDVRSLFNQHYVKTGEIPKDLARTYNDLFERRQEGVYPVLPDYGAKIINLVHDEIHRPDNTLSSYPKASSMTINNNISIL